MFENILTSEYIDLVIFDYSIELQISRKTGIHFLWKKTGKGPIFRLVLSLIFKCSVNVNFQKTIVQLSIF